MAGNYGQMAMDAAGNELIIVDTVKTVGGTSIDATAPASEVTAGVGDDAQTTRTGLLDESMNPEATGPRRHRRRRGGGNCRRRGNRH